MSNFWEKPLQELTRPEWEALCDGCGKCCMNKFEDIETGEMLYTSVACRLFDDSRCRCRDYEARLLKVANCVNLHSLKAEQMRWLPQSCAYRLRFEGKPLPEWHYLVTGDTGTIHAAGMSMKNRCISEDSVPEDTWHSFIIFSAGKSDE